MKFNLLISLLLWMGTGQPLQTITNVTKSSETSISVSEDDKTYQFSAKFDADLMPKVLDYMDDHLKDAGMSFKNVQADADLTLNSKMTFHMKSSPGKLAFKFDKRKNSADFYKRFKEMCEGLKIVISRKK